MSKQCPKCKSDNPGTAAFCADCGTHLPSFEEIEVTETMEAPKEELTRGITFAGRYEIIEELGKGGMGRVYRVDDTKLKQEVALKLIKPEIAQDKKTIERFRNELKLARNIRHKNVCGMYDLGEAKGAHFITMEYIRGEDLRSSIRRFGQLPIGKSISIAYQICEGLAEAHRLGVVHRDLKSNNIMIDKEGNVRIMDFGIARSLEAKGITGAGVMIGTPEYMSPEQVEGKEVDQRSDIYSLGVILYEMVTGRVPFEGDTPFTVGMKHKGEMPQNPKELNSQISDELNRVILRCLEKEKEQRYQSAGEVRSQLENIERGIPTTERVIPDKKPLTSREITVTFGMKKLLIPALVIIAVVIIGFVLWQILPGKKTAPLAPSGKPSLAIMYFQNNTGDQNLDIWRDGLSRMLIADLSQSKYLRIVSDDQLYGILSQLNLLEAKNYSTEDLKEVATRGGSTHVLRGILTKSGDSFRINTTLQEANTMEIIASEMVEGTGEGSLHTMVDELTRRIKESFKLSESDIASDIDRDIGEITTSSPEAYKYYIEATKFFDAGDYRKAIQLYETATAVDPGFATAYRSMAMAYYNMGFYAEGDKFVQKAFELSDRVSDRELYRNKAEFYRISEKTYDQSIEAYKKLLELYPDDRSGNNNLALIYEEIEEFDRAIELYILSQKGEISDFLPTTNLASLYRNMGRLAEAKEVIEEYLEKYEDNANLHWALATIYQEEGNYALALQENDKATMLNPTHFRNFLHKGDILFCKGDMSNAEKEYKKLLSLSIPSSNALGSARLTEFYSILGRIEDSKIHFKQSIELAHKMGQKVWEERFSLNFGNKLAKMGFYEEAIEKLNTAHKIAVETENRGGEREALFSKGLALVMMGSSAEAQKAAEELGELCQKSLNKRIIRLYHFLEGMIALENGNYDNATELIAKALSLDPNHYKSNLDLLGMAYVRSGNLDKAITTYEKITNCPSGIRTYGDVYVKSFYMNGKIYEKLGDTAKAIEHYEKFLDLWKDADPGLPEVEDARKRLAGLKNQ